MMGKSWLRRNLGFILAMSTLGILTFALVFTLLQLVLPLSRGGT